MKAKEKSWCERVKSLSARLGGKEALAAKLGVSFWTVMRWENSSRKPSSLARHRIEELEKEEVTK